MIGYIGVIYLVETIMKSKLSSLFVISLVMLVTLACSLFPSVDLKQIEASAMPGLKGLQQTAMPDINKLKTMAPKVEKVLTPAPTTALPPGQKPVLPPPEFPVPADAANLSVTTLGDYAMVNFQTQLSLKDTMTFCRNRMASRGDKEVPGQTSTSDIAFSMVFAGPSAAKQIIIQGLTVGGMTNVNARSEKGQ
jgi:hypothetical protein